MEKYENLGMIGEGSYGMVMKCRHKETGQLVAIKKFLETEEDKMVKKIAMREVRMLKQVRHENLINLIEVFRRKKRLYLVFEFVDHTALDDLERFPTGAEESFVKKVMWQVLKGVEFCHTHNIIHRDVKPENILISKRGVVKLCDFGFARTIAPPGEAYTDYVATRWYRAPELLVGDTGYGRAIDIWAVGCLFSEMLTGEPLFPGESDIDQLYLVTKCFGHLISRHREVFSRNPLFLGMRLPESRELEPLERRYPRLSSAAMDIIKWSLRLDPNDRPTCSQLLRHELFTKSSWSERFSSDLRAKIEREFEDNPILRNMGITIHGSVLEHRQRAAQAEHNLSKKSLEAGGYTTAGGQSSGTDAHASDVEHTHPRKKEKKKKTKKELLNQREKAQPERLEKKVLKYPAAAAMVKTMELPHTLSQHSLVAASSQTRLSPLPPPHPHKKQLHSPHPHKKPNALPLKNFHDPLLGHAMVPPPHHYSHPSQPPRSPSHPPPLSRHNSIKSQISIVSPPGSLLDAPTGHMQRHVLAGLGLTQSTASLSNGQHPLTTLPPSHPHSELPSDTSISLISDRTPLYKPKISPLPERMGNVTSPLASPGLSRYPPATFAPFKKQTSKNKDSVFLPHLKDVDRHKSQLQYVPLTTGGGGGVSAMNSGSQNGGLAAGGTTGNRSILLTSLRHPPTPPSQSTHNDRGDPSTSFPIL